MQAWRSENISICLLFIIAEYQHDTSLIPKNTSLIISRVPVANQSKKLWDASNKPVQARVPSKVEKADFDLSKMEGSEEDKIQAMMMQSTAEYDPKRLVENQAPILFNQTMQSKTFHNFVATKR